MGEIWALYVATNHWAKGVGLALWDAAREGLQDEGCTHVSVWVPMTNDRAMRFFELAGLKREMASAKTIAIGGIKVEEIRLKRPL
jgi:ribosomal protein S18 acetylase RimI-like enzyme